MEAKINKRSAKTAKNQDKQPDSASALKVKKPRSGTGVPPSSKDRFESIVLSIMRSVHQSIDLDEVLENAAEALKNNIDVVEHCIIFLVEGQDAVIKAHAGLPEWFTDKIRRIPYPRGFTWKTIIEGKPRSLKVKKIILNHLLLG